MPGNLDISNKGLITRPDLSSLSVGGNFYCFNNRLTSLVGAPHTVGGDFWCSNNQLTSLEHAPQSFKKLKSDFGQFSSWQEVPEILRISPETRALQQEVAIQAATVLSTPLAVKARAAPENKLMLQESSAPLSSTFRKIPAKADGVS